MSQGKMFIAQSIISHDVQVCVEPDEEDDTSCCFSLHLVPFNKKCVIFLQQQISWKTSKKPPVLNLLWLHCSMSTLSLSFAVTVYEMTHASVVLWNPFFILIQSSRPHLQPAPRARLLSLCTVTLESFRVSLSMALRRPWYSDWSIGYMPEGRTNKRQSAQQDSYRTLFIDLKSTHCTGWWSTTCA